MDPDIYKNILVSSMDHSIPLVFGYLLKVGIISL